MLGERSQVAASEIGELTGDSVKVAEQAGGVLEGRVPELAKTAGRGREMAAASEEQAGGVGQITGATQPLDQATQHNAASSEALAATAQELRSQSRALLDVICFFRLSQQGPAARPVREADAGNETARVAGSDNDPPRANRGMDTSVAGIDENQLERCERGR